MASNNSKSKSILRSSSESKSKSSRRGVSFATNINTERINTNTAARRKHRTNADDTGDTDTGDTDADTASTNTGKSRMMNDVEEDAFDPSLQQQDTDMSILDLDNTDTSSLSLKQIRDLKSKRAMQRVAAGAVDVFDAEEEGDECYSLLQQDNEGQGQGQEGLNLNDNQSTITSKNNNDNNDNSEKQKQKQDACPIEPFNMTSEREDGSGYFDGDTYVFRRGNPEEEEDAWLDQLDENTRNRNGNINGNINGNTSKDSSSNINAMNNTNTQSSITSTSTTASNARDARTRAMNEMTKEQIYDELVPLLATDSESILQALGRYGSIIKRETKQLKLLRKKQAKDPTQETQSQSQSQSQSQIANIKKEPSASTKALNRLTELSNVCMMKYDDSAIYDRDRAYFTNILGKSDAEETMKRKRSYFAGADADVNVDAGMNGIDHGVAAKRSRGEDNDAAVHTHANTANASNASKDESIHVQVNTQWEYRGNEDNAIHGPYKTQEMMEWIKAGYFVGPMAVDVRMITRDATYTNGGHNVGHNGGGHNDRKDEIELKSKEEVVDDLLGDLEDSDDENENENESEGEAEAKGRETGIDSAIASEWQRSDEIDFSKYQ